MEISAQRSPARMEPCVQTALEALIVSVSRVSLEPSARKVRRRRQDFAREHHFWFASSASFPLCFHNADETLCTLEKDQGCSQFCKPGYISYECSCARGWKLNTDKKQCVPQGTSVMYWNYFFLHVLCSSLKKKIRVLCLCLLFTE